MMYEHYPILNLIKTTEEAVTWDVSAYGILVYVDTDPDDIAPDIYIDPADSEGIAIFREFAAKMAVHYKTLKK